MSAALNELRDQLGIPRPSASAPTRPPDRTTPPMSLREVRSHGVLGTDRLRDWERVSLALIAVVAGLRAAFDPQLAAWLAQHGGFGPAHAALTALSWPAPHLQQILSGVGAGVIVVAAASSRACTALDDLTSRALVAGLVAALAGNIVAFLTVAIVGVVIATSLVLGAIAGFLLSWALLS